MTFEREYLLFSMVPGNEPDGRKEPVSTIARDRCPGPVAQDERLRLTVVLTKTEATSVALRTAGRLADRLSVYVTLLAIQVVPYALSLDPPQAAVKEMEQRMVDLVSNSGLEAEEVHIRIARCRDPRECLQNLLPPRSIVLVGAGRWPWSRERQLGKWMASLGHCVIFVPAAQRHLTALSEPNPPEDRVATVEIGNQGVDQHA